MNHSHAPAIIDEFTLRCVRFYPGVNSRAALVILSPCPKRRSRRWLGDYLEN